MPSRYTLFSKKEDIKNHFEIEFEDSATYQPSYNVVPESRMPVARIDHSGRRVIKIYQWGIPLLQTREDNKKVTITNVAKEQFQEDAYWAGLLHHKRCLIPANGFYEWKKLTNNNEPFYLRMLNKELIGIAGLYDQITNENGEKEHGFVMVNVQANAMVKPLNEHMPAILNKKSYDLWLNRDIEDINILKEVLQPTVIYEMAALRVPELVNNPENDRPELIQPIPK